MFTREVQRKCCGDSKKQEIILVETIRECFIKQMASEPNFLKEEGLKHMKVKEKDQADRAKVKRKHIPRHFWEQERQIGSIRIGQGYKTEEWKLRAENIS